MFVTGCLEPDTSQPRANAAFVVLARNKELDGVVQSIKSIERHFNRWYNYPYVFLNDADFNQTFKETVVKYTSGPVEFGKVGPDMWGYPDWIDPKVAKEGINKQGDEAIMYGGLESYHFMCRFYSGYAAPSPHSQCAARTLPSANLVPASSTSTRCCKSTSGTGDWSPTSSISATSPSTASLILTLSSPYLFFFFFPGASPFANATAATPSSR